MTSNLESDIVEEQSTIQVRDLNVEDSIPQPKPLQKKRHRCFSCSRKVGTFGYECRCGYIFCGVHRLPFEHSCSHKQENRIKMIKIETQKMEYI